MIILENTVFIDIKIDGNSIPDSYNLISIIALTEGNGTLFPACVLIFNDLSGNLTDQLNLTDGNSLTVTTGKTPEDVSTVTRQYRVFGVRQQISPAGPQIKVVGIYDAPAFTTANVREGLKGTTDQVMQKIAEICQLEYDGPSITTNDSQVWLNICRNRATFVKDLARHGYIDPYSAMDCIVTSLGVLKYKNLADLIDDPPTYTLFHNVPPGGIKGKAYIVKQAKDSSTSGMMNSWQNYGSTKVIHSLDGAQTVEDKLEVKTSGKYLILNQQVSDTVGMSRVETSPLDCSNVHSKYERAYYQNIRLLGLFCEKVSVLITEATDIQLYDTIYYRQADADLMKAAEPSDIYLVVGKSVFVKGSQSYAERLEICRMTVTNKGAAALATQDPASLREAVIPTSYVNPTIQTALTSVPLVSLITQLFAALTGHTNSAYANMGQLGGFTNSASLQLNSLVNLMAGGGIENSADKALTALKLVNTPSGYLSSTTSALASNYSNIEQQLDAITSQIGDLPQAQQDTINRAGLQKASLFNPGGAVTSLALALPMLKSLATVSSLYASVQQGLNTHSSALINLDPSAGPAIDEYNSHADNIAIQYSGLSTSTNNIWNKVIGITNGQPVPKDLYNYADNASVLNELSQTTLAVPQGQMSKVTPVTSTVNTMAGMFQTRDVNGRLLWMYPPTPVDKTYKYSASDLPSALKSMNSDSTMLTTLTQENVIG